METSNILCISISVQTYQDVLKTLYVYVVYIWYFYKATAALFKYPIYIVFIACLLGSGGCLALVFLKIW